MQHNGENTKLEKGDICRWFKGHGTITFIRDLKHMRIHEGQDDKFCVQSISFLHFAEMVKMVSEATGMKASIHADNEQFADYIFS